MILNTCKDIEEHLVDYTDGLLDGATGERVAEHLRQCEACQRRVDALNRSLTLTRVIWQDSLQQSQRQPVIRRWVLRATAAAAIVSIASLIAFRFLPAQPVAPQLTAEQVALQIEGEASAARLLATAELLARKPHGQALAQRQYQYVLDHYPATRAGRQTKTQLR